jgi:Arylsulfotransferase (ASST)
MTLRAPAPLLPALLAGLALCAGLCGCGDSDSSNAVAESVTPTADLAAAQANPVTVSPMPGTEDASPATQISFLGAGGTQVADVRAVGSRSGVHGGRLESYSTGTGASFLPAHPFLAGERVTVHALVGTGAGPPSQSASTTFTIAHQATVSQKQFPNNPGDPHAVQHYASAPTLAPATVHITTPAKSGASPGDLFLAPYQGEGSPGPMIAEQNGALVWFHPLPAGESATNFQVQQYEGEPVLTWWQGRILEVGFGQGEDVIYDSSYRPVAYIRAGNGYHADLHEVRLTPQGTAWIDAFDPVHLNLSSLHGSSDGVVNDSVIQEIDVKTGLVMWEWHALGHIALSESHSPVSAGSSPWDYVHINSVDPGGGVADLQAGGGAGSGQPGDVLLSSRGTWTLYDVDIHSGGFRWRLGDRHSSFKLGPGTRFYWQHDAEFQPGGDISVFDNGSDPPKEKQSRGLLLAPDLANHTVTLVKQLINPTHTLLASSQGNLLNLSADDTAGNWLMGYGGLPNFTEFDASGHVLLDGTLGHNVQDFRTYLAPWNGHPTSAPSVAAQSSAGGALTLAVSWNGATEVASWQVLAGASATSLAPAASASRSGFQTSIAVKPAPAYVAVQALNGAGAAIGRSPTIKG